MTDKIVLSKEDENFVAQRQTVCGKQKALEMLSNLKALHPETKEKPSKVYINIYGAEVHVNGPTVAPVTAPETLQQKIARFERLAESVRANRALLAGLQADFFADEESDEDEEKAMEEIDSVDDFGDHYVVKTQQHMSFGKQKDSGAAATDNVSVSQSIEGDEPSQVAAPSAAKLSQDSDMLEDKK